MDIHIIETCKQLELINYPYYLANKIPIIHVLAHWKV